MIYGILHKGSGLGNQLHRYVMTRVVAHRLRCDFGMIAPENFKGSSFMTIDTGKPWTGTYEIGEGGKVIPFADTLSYKMFEEKKVIENGVDVRGFDPETEFIEENTVIDGEFQDERYFLECGREIQDWLKTEPLGVPNDLCVIGFRGGEFVSIPDLFLPTEYWEEAIKKMKEINPKMKFQCVTDDPETARMYLPQEVKITHDIGMDWRLIRYARYLIIANSSFYILPSLLNLNARKIIAPRYWARRNTGVWALPQNFYRKFCYL